MVLPILITILGILWIGHDTDWQYRLHTPNTPVVVDTWTPYLTKLINSLVCYDFSNGFKAIWLEEFKDDDYLESYFKLADKHQYAIPGKECIAWWKSYIKQAKPGSPNHPLFYDGLRVSKFNPVCEKPRFTPVRIGCGTDWLCGQKWMDKHMNDILPEQTIEIKRVKVGHS